ncbi:hypothetical protein BH23PLA1_BH23PLA1_07000 [soil metagenome]
MLRTLLVGLDGTADSDAALELGIRWARQFDALLVGLGVVDEPGIHGAEEVWLGEVYFRQINEKLTTSAHRQVNRSLERAAIRCAEEGVAFKPLEDVGSPHERILIEAQRYDIILMGQRTHFRFGWQDHADDTLRRVLTENPRPVVAVQSRPEVHGESVLVAFDGNVPSARSLHSFLVSGLAQLGPVHVLCAKHDRLEAARHAERAVEFLRFHEIKAQPHAIAATGNPSKLIIEHVR